MIQEFEVFIVQYRSAQIYNDLSALKLENKHKCDKTSVELLCGANDLKAELQKENNGVKACKSALK